MKISWNIIGHKKILDLLEKHILSRPSHAYLFIGEEHLGKRTVAEQFAKILECNDKTKRPCEKCLSCVQFDAGTHPDIIVLKKEPPLNKKSLIRREGKIKIGKVRHLKRIFSLKPHSSPYKICLAPEADKLNEAASNALLKILEEPLGNVIFILIAPHVRALLPTIVSRCEIIKFFPIPKNILSASLKNKVSKNDFEKIVAFSRGRAGIAFELSENSEIIDFYNKSIKELTAFIEDDEVGRFKTAEKMSKNLVAANKILNVWLSFFRDIIILKSGNQNLILNIDFKKEILKYSQKYAFLELKEIIKAILYTKSLFLKNVNPRLSLETLFLKI